MRANRAAALLAVALAVAACTNGARPTTTHRPIATASEPSVDLLAGSPARCPLHPRTERNGTIAPPAHPQHAARLAPTQPPTAVLICRYDGLPARFTGARRVTQGLDALPLDLAWRPLHLAGTTYGCATVYRPHFGYLMQLRYGDRYLWVGGDTDSCTGITNGTVWSDFGLGTDVEHAFATGRWQNGIDVDGGAPNECFAPPWGRLGQEHRLVPGTPTTLTLCAQDGHAVSTANLSDLVRLLNSRPARPTSSSCQPEEDSGNMIGYEARFSYAHGPPVVVSINKDCDPKLSNTSLEANDDGAAWREADRLYRGG